MRRSFRFFKIITLSIMAILLFSSSNLVYAESPKMELKEEAYFNEGNFEIESALIKLKDHKFSRDNDYVTIEITLEEEIDLHYLHVEYFNPFFESGGNFISFSSDDIEQEGNKYKIHLSIIDLFSTYQQYGDYLLTGFIIEDKSGNEEYIKVKDGLATPF